MKKILASLLIALTLPATVHAGQRDFQIEGEWYMTTTYQATDYKAVKNEDGSYRMDKPDGESISIFEDGNVIVKDKDGKITGLDQLTLKQIFDDGILAYSEERDGQGGQELNGYLIKKSGNGYTAFLAEMKMPVLFLGGNVIFSNSTTSDASFKYLLDGGNFYMINEKESGSRYVGGRFHAYGEDVFTYEVNNADLHGLNGKTGEDANDDVTGSEEGIALMESIKEFGNIDSIKRTKEKNIENYRAARSAFSESLLNSMVFYSVMEELADAMYKHVRGGIVTKFSESALNAAGAYGEVEKAYQSAKFWTYFEEQYANYEDAMDKAEWIDANLKSYMKLALADYTVSDEEYVKTIAFALMYDEIIESVEQGAEVAASDLIELETGGQKAEEPEMEASEQELDQQEFPAGQVYQVFPASDETSLMIFVRASELN